MVFKLFCGNCIFSARICGYPIFSPIISRNPILSCGGPHMRASTPVHWNAFQLTTSWRWLTECQECAKLSSRQRVATLKNLKSKIYLDLFNTFLVTTWFHMCYLIVLMSSLLLYNIENSKIKKNPWMSRCPNFWLVLYLILNIYISFIIFP